LLAQNFPEREAANLQGRERGRDQAAGERGAAE
jgi:hypothetical protein